MRRWRRKVKMFRCACGCGRAMPGDSGWDGMHGPGSQKI